MKQILSHCSKTQGKKKKNCCLWLMGPVTKRSVPREISHFGPPCNFRCGGLVEKVKRHPTRCVHQDDVIATAEHGVSACNHRPCCGFAAGSGIPIVHRLSSAPRCPTSPCSSHFVAGARKGLHACRSARSVLVVVGIEALYTIQAYRSPSAGHHEVLGLLVCECDKASMNVSMRSKAWPLTGGR
jgi:hypothetical protein